MKSDYFKGVKLMGSKDVQLALGVSRSFIQRIIEAKLIPCQKTSAGWIFPEEAVLAFHQKRIERSGKDRRIRV